MRLRTKYVFFVSLLHGLALVLSFFIFRELKILFIAAEAVILLSAFFAWRLYLQLIRPLRMLLQGADAIRDQDFNVKFLLTGQPEMDQLIGVYNDMMDHLREERTRQEEQHFFLEKMIQTSPTGIVVLDFDERIYSVNPRAISILGMDAGLLKGRLIADFDLLLLREMAALGTGESGVVMRNGIECYKIQKSHFVDRGFARHFIMVEEMTEEILAAEKRAYGKVIRMMAHEVNNTIGPVNSIMETVMLSHRRMTDTNGGIADTAGEIADKDSEIPAALRVAIQRNVNLNYFMRNFADLVRLPAPNKQAVMMDQLVGQVVSLMRRGAPAGKEIIFEGQGQDWVEMIDEQQMEQVLINIIKNALEAIAGSGQVWVCLDPAARRLVVRDNGVGIDPSVEGKLFSPFFSTKRQGQGIGLTLIREVLMGHGFAFSLSTNGQGITAFEVRFC